MTARGVARIYSALLGHVDGVRFVSDTRRAAIDQPSPSPATTK